MVDDIIIGDIVTTTQLKDATKKAKRNAKKRIFRLALEEEELARVEAQRIITLTENNLSFYVKNGYKNSVIEKLPIYQCSQYEMSLGERIIVEILYKYFTNRGVTIFSRENSPSVDEKLTKTLYISW